MKVKKSICKIITAVTLLICMSFTTFSVYADDKNALATPSSKVAYCIERYRIFLEKTAKEYPVDTWRFGIAYIDGDEVPELLVAMADNNPESQVQVYSLNDKNRVEYLCECGSSSAISYVPYGNLINIKPYENIGEKEILFDANREERAYVYNPMNLKRALEELGLYYFPTNLKKCYNLYGWFLTDELDYNENFEFAVVQLSSTDLPYLVLREKKAENNLSGQIYIYRVTTKRDGLALVGYFNGANLIYYPGSKMIFTSEAIIDSTTSMVNMTGYKIENKEVVQKEKFTSVYKKTPLTTLDESGKEIPAAKIVYTEQEEYTYNGKNVDFITFHNSILSCVDKDAPEIVFHPITYDEVITSFDDKIDDCIEENKMLSMFIKYDKQYGEIHDYMSGQLALNKYHDFIEDVKNIDFEDTDKQEFYRIDDINSDGIPEMIFITKNKTSGEIEGAMPLTYRDFDFFSFYLDFYPFTREETIEYIKDKQLYKIEDKINVTADAASKKLLNIESIDLSIGYNDEAGFGKNFNNEAVNWELDIQLSDSIEKVNDIVCSWTDKVVYIGDEVNIDGKYCDYGWSSVLQGNTHWNKYVSADAKNFIEIYLPDDPKIAGRQYIIINGVKIEFELIYFGDYDFGMGWEIANVSVSVNK